VVADRVTTLTGEQLAAIRAAWGIDADGATGRATSSGNPFPVSGDFSWLRWPRAPGLPGSGPPKP
jgi:hypothetical protein